MAKFNFKTKGYILGTVMVGGIISIYYLVNFKVPNAWLLLALTALASITHILKVEGSTARSNYQISFLIYGFTLILLGTQAAVFVILVAHIAEWLWYRYPWYIQSFNMGSFVITIGLTGAVYDRISLSHISPSMGGVYDVLGILAAMAIFTFINHLMIGLVLKLARGESFSESQVFGWLPLMIDFSLFGMGAAAGVIWKLNPYAVVLVVIPLYLIYSTLKVPALERKSDTDPKTGLFNARYFMSVMESELNRANRFDRPLTVVMADLDLLRNINNTYGHLAGDEVLISIANILKNNVRNYDLVSRFGGEEFAILMPETTPEAALLHIEAIRTTIENIGFVISTSVTPIKVTLSFGIAGRKGFDQSPKNLLNNADAALYRAKLQGRNRVWIYSYKELENLFGTKIEIAPVHKDSSLEERLKPTDIPYDPSHFQEVRRSNTPSEKQSAVQTPSSNPGRTGPTWLVDLFIGGLACSGLGLFALIQQPVYQLDWVGLMIFAGIVLLTEFLSIDIYVRTTAVSTSAVPMLAGILLFGPIGALTLSFCFATAAMIKHHSRISRFVFNTSNQLLAGMLCLSLIWLTRTTFNAWPPLVQLIFSLVSAAIVYYCTTVMVAVAISLDNHLPVWKVWYDQFSWLASYYFAMGLVAYALIYSYQVAGVIGTTIILVPLLILRYGQRQFIERTKANVNELRTKNTELEERSAEIARLNEELLAALSEIIESHDPYVMGHSKSVAHYAVKIAQQLGLPPKRIEAVRKAALLHDIGKLGIPETILRKSEPLTPKEYDLIKQHVVQGATSIEKIHSLNNLASIVVHHHERHDGKGYPDGLSDQEIPLEARILALADAIDAMASDRPYRRALDYQEILDEIRAGAGKQFDPVLVHALFEIVQSEGLSVFIHSAQDTPG